MVSTANSNRIFTHQTLRFGIADQNDLKDQRDQKIIDSALIALKAAIQAFYGADEAKADMEAEGHANVYTINMSDTSVSLFMNA